MEFIKTRFKVAAQFALMLAMVMIGISLIVYVSGLLYFWGGVIGKLIHGIVFLTTIIILMAKWKKSEANISYWNALIFIIIVVLIYVLIMFCYDYAFFKFIAPDYFTELRDKTIAMMLEYNVPEASINDAELEFEKGISSATPFKMSFQLVVSRILADLILGFILAIFFRKKNVIEPLAVSTF
jgi:hypothetical protein